MNATSRNKDRSSAAKARPANADKGSGAAPAVSRPLAGGARRRGLLGAALVAFVIGGTAYAWNRWGNEISSRPEYVLQPEGVEITSPPDWVRADVRAEVIRDGGLAGLSILDRQLTVKVAQAFSAHSWVENVSRVSKKKDRQARVIVELNYRKPVAMVEVVMDNQPGLLPIDAAGVLLPPEDFREQWRDYLRIAVPQAAPVGLVGTPWGQAYVHEAARIAAIFQDVWKTCGLYRIQLVPSGSENSTHIQPTFELHSRGGATVVWGRAPDLHSEADVKSAAGKVAAVLQYVQANGSLETANAQTRLDLREPAAATARTVSRLNQNLSP